MANNFWFKFYFKEWADDVKPLSLSARGLLVELIIHLRKCSGEMPVDIRLIIRLTGATTEEINSGMKEFRDHKIFDFEKAGDIEILRSRKIIKELHKSLVNKENGAKGGNPKLTKLVKRTKKKKDNQKDNPISDSDFNSNSIFKNKEGGKKLKGEYDLSFIDNVAFKGIFQRWLNYKSDRKEWYVSADSLETCYRKLIKFSNNNLSTATEIIDKAIGNNWAGFFELDEKNQKPKAGTELKNAEQINKSFEGWNGQ